MTTAEELASWVCALDLADIPAHVADTACRHLLDGFGTALAARRLHAVDHVLTVARGLGGPPEAAVPGDHARVSAPAAALACGALVHALDFDDTHTGGLVHATATVLPAAFAVGRQTGASGADVLTAAVAGYETVCRIAAASPHGFHARGLHATHAAGVFAAAAVTSRLLGLDATRTTHALGIAGSGAGGLLEFLSTGAATKQLHPGMASHSGILAARLAAAGAEGPDTVLEGPRGLYAAMSARPADPALVTAGLGTRWETTRITIKPYPACQLMHAALDAASRALGGTPPGAVRDVVVGIHPDAADVVSEPPDTKPRPRTVYDAKFSLPWSVAALLTDGCLTAASYTSDALVRPELAALAGVVRTVRVPSGAAAADAPADVELRLHDGRVLTGRGRSAAASPEAVRGKFHGNAGRSPAAHELADRVLSLADEPDTVAIARLTARTAHEWEGGER